MTARQTIEEIICSDHSKDESEDGNKDEKKD
jgi:hypothetical protein